MTLYLRHPDVEKREMLRIDGIIEPAHKSLNRSVSGCIFRLVGFLFATITIKMK